MMRFLRSLFGIRKPRTLEEELDQRFGRAMMPLVFVSFSAIYVYRLEAAVLRPESLSELQSPAFWGKVLTFAVGRWPQVLLATTIFLWFIIYRNAVKNEIKIVSDLFSKSNMPYDLSGMADREGLWILQYGLVAGFLALAFFVTNIVIMSVFLLFLNLLDLRANGMVRQNVEKYLADPATAPPEADLHRPFILRRREVARNYYIGRNHFDRIFMVVMINVAALLTATSSPVFGVRSWDWVPHVLVVAGIAVNEVRILNWRLDRDARLAAIDRDEMAAAVRS
jgi:hypothetical protein